MASGKPCSLCATNYSELMYIDSPKWRLRKLCPCCEQGSSLLLSTCEKCKRLFVVCEEVGTVFLDAFDISLNKVSTVDHNTCPFCNFKGEIRPSKDYEILGIGLTSKDYE